MEIRKQQCEIVVRHLPVIAINGYVCGRQISALGALEWAWQTFFWGQLINIDETNTFQLIQYRFQVP